MSPSGTVTGAPPIGQPSPPCTSCEGHSVQCRGDATPTTRFSDDGEVALKKGATLEGHPRQFTSPVTGLSTAGGLWTTESEDSLNLSSIARMWRSRLPSYRWPIDNRGGGNEKGNKR
jgi:hypothetical protein